MAQWQKGNLKLEGHNFFYIQFKRLWVLATKSRHCNVYYKLLKYTVTLIVILSIIGIFFAIHFYFYPEDYELGSEEIPIETKL